MTDTEYAGNLRLGSIHNGFDNKKPNRANSSYYVEKPTDCGLSKLSLMLRRKNADGLQDAFDKLINYVSSRSPYSLPGPGIAKSAHTILVLKEDQTRSESDSATADKACIPILEVCFDSEQSHLQPG